MNEITKAAKLYEEPILFKTPIGELPKKTRLAEKVRLLYKD